MERRKTMCNPNTQNTISTLDTINTVIDYNGFRDIQRRYGDKFKKLHTTFFNKENKITSVIVGNKNNLKSGIVALIKNHVSSKVYIFVFPYSYYKAMPDNDIRIFFDNNETPRINGSHWQFCKGTYSGML